MLNALTTSIAGQIGLIQIFFAILTTATVVICFGDTVLYFKNRKTRRNRMYVGKAQF